MKYDQVYDGEWVSPNMRGWRQKCCRCGLVHTFQFRVIRHGKRNEVQFRAWRHPRKKKRIASTCTASRRHTGEPMKIPNQAISHVVSHLLTQAKARRATKFLDEETVVSAMFMHKPRLNERATVIVLKLGKPNFRERLFIKACKKAGEPFPVKKVQLKFFPKA